MKELIKLKYSEKNTNISAEYVNTFRIYPSESEIVIDFAHVDYAATKLKAETDGRDRPDELILETKSRLVLPPVMIKQLYDALVQMMPKKEVANDSEENIGTDSSDRSADIQ